MPARLPLGLVCLKTYGHPVRVLIFIDHGGDFRDNNKTGQDLCWPYKIRRGVHENKQNIYMTPTV